MARKHLARSRTAGQERPKRAICWVVGCKWYGKPQPVDESRGPYVPGSHYMRFHYVPGGEPVVDVHAAAPVQVDWSKRPKADR